MLVVLLGRHVQDFKHEDRAGGPWLAGRGCLLMAQSVAVHLPTLVKEPCPDITGDPLRGLHSCMHAYNWTGGAESTFCHSFCGYLPPLQRRQDT
jgi:hypothetical protein